MVDATERTLRDAEPSVAPSSEMRLAGRYRLRGILGRGGMGTVYRAEDLELGELIALKIVAKGTAASPEAADQQRDEVRLARRVTHPNVARTFDMGEHDNLRFITMELVDGSSLRDVIQSEMPLVERLVLVGHVALGLDAIHAAGIAHRDLKPENVLVSGAGIAKITDFGIARPAESVAAGMTTGTPRYMAPEVLAGAAPTPAADVYAFGLVAAEVILGTRFAGGSLTALGRSLARVLGEGHGAIATILDCLAESPASRPKSTRALGELLAGGQGAATTLGAMSSPARARLCASVFAADAADAWLADAIPDQLLRGIARGADFEVVSSLLPLDDALRAGGAAGADVVLVGAVQRSADDLRVTVRMVSVADELTLWARTDVSPMALLPSRLVDMASEIVLAVSDQRRAEKTTQEQDPRVTELLLRAAHEDHDPWRDFSTAASDLLEEARRLAPDDPTVLAPFALATLGGGGVFDEERYRRARAAAERAVELDGASCECQLALAATLFVSNDPIGALGSVRAVLRAAPAMGDAHGFLGAMAMDVGLFRDAIGRSGLAIAMRPDLAIARFNVALAHEYSGNARLADATIDDGLSSSSMLAKVLSVIGGARIAVWRGSQEDIDAFIARIGPLQNMPLVAPVVEGLMGRAAPAEVLRAIGPMGGASPLWGRQYCMLGELHTELAIHAGDLATATQRVQELVAAGSYNSSWISKSPIAKRLPDVPEIATARAVVETRAEAVLRAMREGGLVGAPRLRAVR